MGGVGRPIHFFARELLARGHSVLFVEVVKSENVAPQKNLRVLSFAELGYTETALRRAWFGLDPRIHSRETFLRALDEFETPHAERVVMYADPFVPFVEWFSWFRERGYKIVYDALDDFEAFPEIGLYFANVEAEKFLVAQSDLVLAVSTTLVEKLSQWEHRAPIHLLRQGFDVELFRAYAPKHRAPPNAAAFTLGFWGHVNAFNVDVGLIEYLARARPQWTIELIGPIDVDSNLPRVEERLRAVSNVKLLGRVAHEELPRYLERFNVALIPFPDNAFNRARDPLKVYEYLSGYKPVVATHLPQLANMPYVYLADSPQEFLQAVERAANISIDRSVIDAYLKNCTWRARVDELLVRLQEISPLTAVPTIPAALWYRETEQSANVRHYIARTEQLLDERTRYIHNLKSDVDAKQAHINKLQSFNVLWWLKQRFSRK